jgi:hypothetical protein
VREVEAVSRRLKQVVADQLLDPFGRLALVDTGGMLNESELELASDDRRDGDELTGTFAETPQPLRDDLPHAFGQCRRGSPVTTTSSVTLGFTLSHAGQRMSDR